MLSIYPQHAQGKHTCFRLSQRLLNKAQDFVDTEATSYQWKDSSLLSLTYVVFAFQRRATHDLDSLEILFSAMCIILQFPGGK